MTDEDHAYGQDTSKSKHVFSLARELLDDIELGRLPAESLLLKTTRLARFVGAPKIQQWLQYELTGYSGTDPLSIEYMSRTGRWTNIEKREGYWGPLAQIESAIETKNIELKATQVPSLSGDYMTIAVREVLNKSTAISSVIVLLSGIKSRVLAHIHDFVSQVFYEKAFSGLAEDIFEKYKSRIDLLLAERCGDVIKKLPYIYDRLAEGDHEAVSQALTTCRRIIDGFADAVYPASDKTVQLEGNVVELGSSHHKNRINAYIAERIESDSRRKRLRQSLSNLYERVSAGVHDDVSVGEAQALFFATYLLLGEILTLDKPNKSSSNQ